MDWYELCFYWAECMDESEEWVGVVRWVVVVVIVVVVFVVFVVVVVVVSSSNSRCSK